MVFLRQAESAPTLMKRFWNHIDLHVVVVGFFTAALFGGSLGLVAQSPPPPIALLIQSALLVGVFLSPMILVRAWDKRRFPKEARSYLLVQSTVILMSIALAFGLGSLLPLCH